MITDICKVITAKPLHNCDIDSVHLDHSLAWGFVTLRRYFSMLTYIYLNVDKCLSEQTFQL